jgi:serine/threonine-protein kinase
MSKQPLPSRFFPNEEIGSIRLLKVLRVRKNGEIWCGADLEKGELRAIKFLYPELFREAHFRALSRFLQGVSSPAIIKVFRTGTTDNGFPYILMEYASKGSLRACLKRRKRLTFAQSVYLMRQMLNALCLLHSYGVVHRDIKPENILIADDGSLRLIDFGIARFPEVEEARGKVFGTPRYCAPEQTVESSKSDCRSDLYSLGAVLFEVLSGTPFREEDSFLAAGRKKACPCNFLNEFSTPQLTALIAELLEFSPAVRPDSPLEVLERLDTMGLPEAALTD